MSSPHITEIIRTVGTGINKHVAIVWYEYGNGDRFQTISASFKLDGQSHPPGTILMKRKNAPYAVAMTPEEFSADQETRR